MRVGGCWSPTREYLLCATFALKGTLHFWRVRFEIGHRRLQLIPMVQDIGHFRHENNTTRLLGRQIGHPAVWSESLAVRTKKQGNPQGGHISHLDGAIRIHSHVYAFVLGRSQRESRTIPANHAGDFVFRCQRHLLDDNAIPDAIEATGWHRQGQIWLLVNQGIAVLARHHAVVAPFSLGPKIDKFVAPVGEDSQCPLLEVVFHYHFFSFVWSRHGFLLPLVRQSKDLLLAISVFYRKKTACQVETSGRRLPALLPILLARRRRCGALFLVRKRRLGQVSGGVVGRLAGGRLLRANCAIGAVGRREERTRRLNKRSTSLCALAHRAVTHGLPLFWEVANPPLCRLAPW